MLSREKRLRKNSEFDSVYKFGKYFSSKILRLYVLKKDSEKLRCGFAISKKVSKKAVIRNKIKRQLSHIFREEFSNLKNNFDIVFVARVNILDSDFCEIKNTVNYLLKKSDVYN